MLPNSLLMNAKMRELMTTTVRARTLAPHLVEILDLGFLNRDECTFLAAEADKAHFAGMDATGSECFVNHLHIESFPVALLFAGELTAALGKRFHERFVVILSFDDGHVTVRFHKDRPGTAWLDVDDLEQFKEEAIGVLYSA